jgi:phospholipid/cholesterol/gamma-HCH transport system substrate-binding protein
VFGQKFITFVRPTTPRGSLHDGQVIPADRVETNVELSKILADLFPLLRAVQPAELNYTLNALATALQGRGEAARPDPRRARLLPRAISDKLPTLKQDLVSLANVADTYDLAAPGPDRRARQPHGDQQDGDREGRRPQGVLRRRAGLAATSTRVLSDNEKNLIQVGKVSEPVLRLLASTRRSSPV